MCFFLYIELNRDICVGDPEEIVSANDYSTQLSNYENASAALA